MDVDGSTHDRAAPAPNGAAEPASTPVAETLLAVSQEVGDLARISDRLQALISEALIADGTTNADHLREFQAIDLLVQRLHGVATFLETFADLAPAHWRLDATAAASNVLLTALANRLTGRSAVYQADPDLAASDGSDDALELFG